MGNNERIYYAFLTEEREVGETSRRSPQHLTFVPPFIADRGLAIEVAADTAKQFGPFKIRVTAHESFGPNREIPVLLVQPAGILVAIHNALLDGLEKRGIGFTDKRFIGGNYKPHIATKPHHPPLGKGDILTVDHIAVMHKNDKERTVLAKEQLDETQA